MHAWFLTDWSSRSVPDLSWDPAIVNSGDVSAADGKFSMSFYLGQEVKWKQLHSVCLQHLCASCSRNRRIVNNPIKVRW